MRDAQYVADGARYIRRIESFIQKVALTFSISFLCGCATMDTQLLEAHKPIIPDVWQSNTDIGGVPVGDWLGAFGDEYLYQIVQEAITHNRDLLLSANRLEQAHIGFQQARADRLPQVSLRGSASGNVVVADPTILLQSGADEDVNPDDAGEFDDLLGGGSTFLRSFNLGMDLQWEVDLWGRLADLTKAQRIDVEASLSDYYAVRMTTAGSATLGWFALIEARLLLDLAHRDVAMRERSLSLIRSRFESNYSSKVDLLVSQRALTSSRVSLNEAEQAVQEASRRLEVLLGRYPAAEIEATSHLPELAPLPDVGAPVEILVRRPDLQAAEKRVEAAGFRARAARKGLLPALSLSSGLSTGGTNIGDLVDPQRLAGNLLSGFTQPLFQGGRLKAQARRQRLAAEASVIAYVRNMLTAFEEAENAIAAENLLAAREDQAKQTLSHAILAQQLLQKRYEAGLESVFTFLDAQNARRLAEVQYIAAQHQRIANRVRLYLAIGGDYLTCSELSECDVPREM